MANKVARHGGIMFQINMFSIAKIAFDMAVMRLVNVPGICSQK
jgi:hypothetical protein